MKNEEIKRKYITLYHATLVFSHALSCGNHTFLFSVVGSSLCDVIGTLV